MASKGSTDQGHQGQVRDPEHDGRLKQNRERDETKGTPQASARRAEEAGHEPSGGGRKAASQHEEAGQKASSAPDQPDQEQGRQQDQAGSSDLKDRAYRGKEGKVHHHTQKYREQHEGEEQQQGEAGKGRS